MQSAPQADFLTTTAMFAKLSPDSRATEERKPSSLQSSFRTVFASFWGQKDSRFLPDEAFCDVAHLLTGCTQTSYIYPFVLPKPGPKSAKRSSNNKKQRGVIVQSSTTAHLSEIMILDFGQMSKQQIFYFVAERSVL
jgi:hypothetical protein